MKFAYITYGKWTTDFRALTPEGRKEKFERIKEEAEKLGFKMLFWGHPFGVSESVVVVYESKKGLEDYANLAVQPFFTEVRTNVVIIP